MRKLELLDLTNENIERTEIYRNLSGKTQMIRNDDIKGEFTNRFEHTKNVVALVEEITKIHNWFEYVDIDRLKLSAKLHDIGHTPFGHAGEDAINALFLSDDGQHYSENFPGLFKHNINSARLISERFYVDESNHILIDSILKHSNVFPKQYNFLVFTEENIAKINYIFRNINFDNSVFLEKFLIEFNKLKCNKCINDIKGKNHIKHCKSKSKLCSCTINNNYKLTDYFLYNAPATIEGTILLWADEISCFISDLYDLLKYMVKYEKNVKSSILMTNMVKNLYLINVYHPENSIVQHINQCLNILLEDRFQTVAIENIKNELNLLQKYLINNLSLKIDYPSKEIILSENCNYLISFKDEDLEIFQQFKKSIYSDIHGMKYIKDTNYYGSIAITLLCKVYYNNFKRFIEDYTKINKLKVESLTWKLCDSISNLFDDTTNIEDLKNEIENFLLSLKSLRFTSKKMSLYISRPQQNIDIMIKNLLKREICYFVATQSEQKVLNLLKNHKKNVPLPKIKK